MKKILLPTDFSDYALNATLTAIKLHHKTPSHFILLHVHEPNIKNTSNRKSSVRTGMVYDAMHNDALKKLDEALNTIEKVSDFKQHEFSIKAASGNLATVISELVPVYDIDLIIMGTKGATEAKQIFLGSNTVKVLNMIRNCSILVIPRKFNFQSLRKIVFPTEFAHFFTKRQLIPLVTFAEQWRSQILIFHVAQKFKLSEHQMANKELLKERLQPVKHSFSEVTIQNTVAKAITKFANEQFADMICLVHYNHTFMEKLTQEPVVKKIGLHTEIPLLILPE